MQVFPVEFHVPTLATLLQHTAWLSPAADVKQLLLVLMERLAAHEPAEDEDAASSPFCTFQAHIATLCPKEGSADDAEGGAGAISPVTDVLELYGALLSFALKVYPGKLAQFDEVLAAAHVLLAAAPSPPAGATATRVLSSLVSRPLEHFTEVLSVLQWT